MEQALATRLRAVPRPRRLARAGAPHRDPAQDRCADANERAETLALEAAREGGKPLIDSRVEVARAIDGVLHCAEMLRSRGRPCDSDERQRRVGAPVAFTQHEPIGVVVAVSAFNHPLNLIVHQVGPAIAAGCPVIVKPAGDTPLSCLRFVAILREAGLPPELVPARW